MVKILTVLLIMGSVSVACATESSIKIDTTSMNAPVRDVSGVEAVERPESLKYDSPAYKKHKEYVKFIDRL